MADHRTETYRYVVEDEAHHITPLASLEAFIGETKIQVMNISRGGIALGPEAVGLGWSEGDQISLSVSIRERPFPVAVEVKSIKSNHVSCSFVEPSRTFQAALSEFLSPKFLGESLQKDERLSGRADVRALVENTIIYEAYLGQNEIGAFVWMGEGRKVQRFLGVSREIAFEWTPGSGLRTGQLKKSDTSNPEGIQWDRTAEVHLLHFFADIVLAWLVKFESGGDFVNKMMSDDPAHHAGELTFPEISNELIKNSAGSESDRSSAG